jgi:hypothetical protein
MTRPNCKCGQPCLRAPKGSPRDRYPACKACWALYLDGHSRDTGASALASHTPPLERDGLLVPAEGTVEWQGRAVLAVARLGRRSPYEG